MIPRLVKIPRKNSVLLLGPRGTGKSTLIREALSKDEPDSIIWIDLLQPEQEEEYQRSPGLLRERILASKAITVVIDEVQRIPKLLDVAHELIESKGIRFVLTGSSARKLKRGSANLLAGRAFALHLDAFTSLELGGRFDLQEALEFGLLPRIYFPDVRDANEKWTPAEKMSFLQAYARTYLREEIQIEQHVRKIQPFRNFLEIAAQMNGKVIEYSNMARDTGVDHKTIAGFFQILEDTLIGFLLEPYHRSVRKRQGKKPKFYFFDPGIKRALDRTLSVPLLPQTAAYGEAFEHFVILELRKRAQVKNPDIRLSFFRTHDGSAEVDLIIEHPGAPLCLVEIKSTRNITEDSIRKFTRIRNDFGNARCFILCQERAPREVGGVRILPWQTGIEELLGSAEATGFQRESVEPVSNPPVHAWRLCPAGEHWVTSHTERIRPSRRHPSGTSTTRRAHCARNPSGKDVLYPAEIAEIASRHFSALPGMPCPSEMGFKGKGARYDAMIAGWVKYWNEVLSPDVPLDSNLVKALIATESSFLPNKLANRKKPNGARGLMQITNSTRKALGDERGELKDHLVIATREELNDPNVNICAGIRWLHWKKRLASGKLGRSATWLETVNEFKGGVSTTTTKKRASQIMSTFEKRYEELNKCES